MPRRTYLLGFLILAPLSFQAVAAEIPEPGDMTIFGGASLGYQLLSTKVLNEADKKGPNLVLKGVGSWYTENWVLDLGAGWRYSRLSSSNVVLSTQSGIIEFSPRYKLTDSLQFGPMVQMLFGTDLTFTETILDEKKLLFLPGLHLNQEFAGDSALYRLGAQVMTDMKLKDQQSFIFLVDFQIRFHESGARRIVEERVTPPPPPPPTPTETEIPIEAPIPQALEPIAEVSGNREVTARFPADKLLFATGMSHLKPGRKAYLGRFARFLRENGAAWKSVDISGHTDRRGSMKINKTLSAARAKTVYNVLKGIGVPAAKMSFVGHASKYPVDPSNNPKAWRKNRRVELKFEGVSKPELFTQELNNISVD